MKADKKTLGVLAAAAGFALVTLPVHAAGGRVYVTNEIGRAHV